MFNENGNTIKMLEDIGKKIDEMNNTIKEIDKIIKKGKNYEHKRFFETKQYRKIKKRVFFHKGRSRNDSKRTVFN